MVTDYVAALLQARMSGRPISLGPSGLTVNPDGSVGTPGGGFRTPAAAPLGNAAGSTGNVVQAYGGQPGFGPGLPGSPSGPAAMPPPATPAWMHAMAPYLPSVTNQPTGATVTAPQLPAIGNTPSGWDLGLNYGTPIPGTPDNPTPTANAALGQVNPNVQTYAGQPSYQGAPGTQSGNVPPGAPAEPASQPSQQQLLAAQAQAYRSRPGAGNRPQFTTDQLNQMSLQAAQQGRTYWNPNLLQPGQPVTNALTLPPSAGITQSALAQMPGQGNVSGSALVPQPGGWTSAVQVPVYQQQLAMLQNPNQLYGGGGAP